MPNSTGVSVESRDFSVIAGDTVQTKATVHNAGSIPEQFTFRIDGLDSDWYNLPVSSTTLFPNDSEELRISLHPPKTDRVKVGLYPFHLIIDCPENPENTERVELTLEVKELPEPNPEIASLDLQITPPIISGKSGKFGIIASNPGVNNITVSLHVTEHDPLLKCNLLPEDLVVPVGEKTESTVEVKLKWLHFFHGRNSYHFTVQARLSDQDGVKNLRGQLVRTPGRIHLPAWLSLPSRMRKRRQPPGIGRFEAITENNRKFNLMWSVDNATEVRFNGDRVESSGEREVYPTESTSYVLTASNKYGNVDRTVDINPLPIPVEKYCDRILALMTPHTLQVAAGSGRVESTIEIQNIGSIVDKFTLEIAGLPGSWYSLSASSVALMPHAKEQVKVYFNPPKIKGVTSHNYVFAVIIRSESLAEDCTSIRAQLEILPSVDYNITLQPYRVRCRRKEIIHVHVTNTDVTEADLFIDVSDIENGLRFKLENDNPTVLPWQTVDIPMLVKPKRNSIVGDLKRYDISLTASTSDGYTRLARGQIDHRPLLSSWRPIFRTLKYIVILGAVALVIYYIIRLGGGWGSLVRDPQTWLDGTIRHIRGWFY